MEVRELLDSILQDINDANNPSMLDGYLNFIGEKYNDQLNSLGFATIDIVDEDEE